MPRYETRVEEVAVDAQVVPIRQLSESQAPDSVKTPATILIWPTMRVSNILFVFTNKVSQLFIQPLFFKMPPRGRPPKKKRNIWGLRNQRTPSPLPLKLEPALESASEALGHVDRAQPDPDQEDCENPNMEKQVTSEQIANENFEASGVSVAVSIPIMGGNVAVMSSTGPTKRPVKLSFRNDREPDDADWIPPRIKNNLKPKKGEW